MLSDRFLSSQSESSDARLAASAGSALDLRRRLVALGSVMWLSLFLLLSIPLAANRHFQVDEFQEAYNSFLLTEPSLQEFTLHPQPFMVALGYLARQLDGTGEILIAFRLVFLVVLIANLVLAVFVQPFFPHPYQRLVCLVALSAFVIFWRHGLEIRHDNLGLTGCLLLYGLTVRSLIGERRRQPWREFGAGLAFFWLLISAHKGFVLAVPFLVLFLWASWQRYRRGLGALSRVAAGILGMALPLAIFLTITGTSASIWRGVVRFFHHLGAVESFSPWPQIFQLASSYPHVASLAAIGVIGAFWRARKRPWKLTVGTLTGCFTLHMMVFLEINQKPYAYNFLYLVPFAFFSALYAARRVGRSLRGRPARAAAAVALTLATLLGGLGSWHRDFYFKLVNDFQLSYIEAAEELTDPRTDSILDGVGMVVTRRPPLRDWQLHGSFMQAYHEGRRQSFADLIGSDPPPVVFTNYRWGTLQTEIGLLKGRYVNVAKDFWLLGEVLPQGSGPLTIHRTGRYLLHTEPPAVITLDGESLQAPTVTHLQEGVHRVGGPTGEHRVGGPTGERILVHWVGPGERLRFTPLPAHLQLLLGGL